MTAVAPASTSSAPAANTNPATGKPYVTVQNAVVQGETPGTVGTEQNVSDGQSHATEYQAPSSSSAPASASSNQGSSPLLVTSNASRTNYATNVTNLNSALNRVSAGTNGGGTSVVDYLKSTGMPSDFASRATLAKQNGIPDYVGSAAQNLQLMSTLQTAANGKPGGAPAPTDPAAAPAPTDGGAGTDTTGAGAAAQAGVNPDGSTTNPDGTVTAADGSSTDPNDVTAGLPPAVASAFKDILSEQEQNIETAHQTLDSLRSTIGNDPAAVQAANAIEQQYAPLIKAMQDKNQVVLGSYTANAARSGSLQYANDMETTFMSDEMDNASSRIADLVSKEQELILKSNTAYQAADVKAFDAAQKELDTVTKSKSDTLAKLLTATNNQVKTVQAQQKIDAAAKKQQLTSDVTLSSKTAAGLVQAVQESGITDPAQIDAYIQDMATKNGITNPDILKSAYVTAQQTAQKAALSAENTQSEINKRATTGSGKASTKGSGVDGGYSYSAGDVGTYTSFLNKGGKAPNGTTYAGRGADGYVDPGAYGAALTDWVAQGGTPTGFAKKFPVKGNVNPSAYAQLPAAVQPTTKAPTSSQYKV